MHRLTTLLAAAGGTPLVLDADGATLDLGALTARLDALERTTGWRKLANRSGVSSGDVWMKRTGPLVEYAGRLVVTSTAGVVDLADVPAGFRPDLAAAAVRLGTLYTDAGALGIASYFSGSVRLVNATANGSYNGRLYWTTTDAWPTTLPGTPA